MVEVGTLAIFTDSDCPEANIDAEKIKQSVVSRNRSNG